MIRLKTLRRWVTFAGCVLVVVVLYWAQAVLVPIAPAILLTFVLTKIADVRSAGKGGSVEKLQDAIEDIKTDLGKSEVP